LLFLTSFLTFLLAAGLVLGFTAPETEEEFLENLENEHLQDREEVSFEEAEIDTRPEHIMGESFEADLMTNISREGNSTFIDFYHYGSSSVSPGEVHKVVEEDGRLKVMVLREVGYVQTMDMSLQKNKYEISRETEQVEIIDITYRERETESNSLHSELRENIEKRVGGEHYKLDQENYNITVGEQKYNDLELRD